MLSNYYICINIPEVKNKVFEYFILSNKLSILTLTKEIMRNEVCYIFHNF